MLATNSGSVDQELRLRNEYLVTENRILKNQIKGRLQLTDPERISLTEIGQRLHQANSVPVDLDDSFQAVATIHDVADRPEVLNPLQAGHATRSSIERST